MNTIIKRALWGTLLAGGIALAGATTANAAESTGEDGLLSGTQALIDVVLPISITGNSVSLVGDSTTAQAQAPATPPTPPASAAVDASTSGQDAAASGTQGVVSVTVPLTVSGNAVSVVGDSTSSDTAPAEPQLAAPAEATTSGESGILSGTQGILSIDVPVTLTGNSVSVIGDSWSEGAETAPADHVPGDAGAATTNGDDGILSGTQLIVPVTVPVAVTGNSVSVIGDSWSKGAEAPTADHTTGTVGTGTNGG